MGDTMSYQIVETGGETVVTSPDGDEIYRGDNIRPDLLRALLSDGGFDERQVDALVAAFGYPDRS